MQGKALAIANDSVRCNKLILSTIVSNRCSLLIIVGKRMYVLVMIVDGVNVEPKRISYRIVDLEDKSRNHPSYIAHESLLTGRRAYQSIS